MMDEHEKYSSLVAELAAAKKQIADILSEREAKCQRLLEEIADGVVMLINDKVYWINAAFSNISGYIREELMGNNVDCLFTSETRVEVNNGIRDCLAGKNILANRQITGQHKTGRELLMELTIRRIEFDNKTAVLLIIRDITERKQFMGELKKERDLIHSILKTANSLIFCIDTEARITIFNDELERFTGYKREEVIGKRWPDIFLPENFHSYKFKDFGEWVRQHPEDKYEGPLVTKSGQVKTILWTNSAILSPDSDEITAIAIGQDITDRKNMEDALRESEKRFRHLTDLLPQTIYEINAAGNITFTNRFGFEFTGYTHEDIDKGLNILQLFVPEDGERIKANLKKRLEGDISEGHEYTLLSKDGQRKPVLAYSSPVVRNDTAIGLRGVVLDVSKLKKTEEELKKFKTISDRASYGTAISDLKGNLIYVNECFATMHGYSTDEIVGKNLSTFNDEEQSPDVNRLNESLRREGSYSAEKVWHTKKDGTVFPVLMNATVIKNDNGKPIFLSVTAIDITEHELLVKERIANEEKIRVLLNASTESIILLDTDLNVLAANETAASRLGLSVSGLLGHNDRSLPKSVLPESVRKIRVQQIQKVIQTGKPARHEDERMGRFFDTSIYPVFDSDGKIIQVAIFGRDITEQKNTERAVFESEERWRMLIENAPHNILTVNSEGIVLFINRTSNSRTPADVIGNKIYDYICPEYHKTIRDKITKALRTGESDNFEARGLDEFGGKYYINQIGPVKHNSQTRSAVIIATDISERKHAEALSRARLRLLNDLRQTTEIDTCLHLGCRAIYEAELFKRAVLTLHNEKREIKNLGFVGLDENTVQTARNSPAPDDKLARKLTREEFRIGNSYFVPTEADLALDETPRYISQKRSGTKSDSDWKAKDELFVPIMGNNNKYEGWLSVDTPFDGKRPTQETAGILEEIVEIVTQKVREIRILEELHRGHMELREKNVALKEILSHIEEEKIIIKRQVAENIDQVLMPAVKKLGKPDGSISKHYLNLITDTLKDLAETSGGLSRAYATLAPREVEVCNLIRHGATTKQIADELFITVGTVKRHRETIRKKLGLKNKDVNLATYLRNL